MRMADQSDAPAATQKTSVGPPTASSPAATSGPSSRPSESSMPRTTLALVNSSGVLQSEGRSAEWAARNGVPAAVAATASR
jgi:hypothetical protein